MQDVEIIGLIKTYIKQTLVGMGALKGAACQIASIVDSGTSHVITFSWQDNAGVTHTNTLTLVDGADEVDELKDISITNLQDGQVLAWDNTAKKWVNTANSSTVASINNIGDVTVTTVTNGQILEWDDTASKWVNASLGTAAKKDSTNAVTENSTDVVESGAVFTAIDDAVKALDVSDTAVAGSYVTEVSETDGKISVTREAADATPTENSNKLVKSGGVYSAIDDAVKALDVSDTAVVGSYVTEVSETDGKISVAREAADATPTENSNKLVKSGGVYTAIDDAVKALDVSDTAVAGSYVTEVSETDGKISVAREAADATPTENSNKLVKSGGVYSANANIYEVMGKNGAKNFVALNKSPYRAQSTPNVSSISTQTEDELIFTTANGNFAQVLLFYSLPIGTYKVSCNMNSSDSYSPKVGVYLKNGNQDIRNVKISDGETKEFTITNEVTHIEIACLGTESSPTAAVRTVTFRNLMIRLASDIDSTYQPYAKTNQQLTQDTNALDSILNKLGAKNLLHYPFKDTTQTVNGVTFTDNGGTISVNGTATAEAVFLLTDWNYDYANAIPLLDRYILNGNPSDFDFSTYFIQIIYVNSSNDKKWITPNADETIVENKGDGYDRVGFRIVVKAGTTVNNVLFKPMLRYAAIADDTFAPYAMTNRELTEIWLKTKFLTV